MTSTSLSLPSTNINRHYLLYFVLIFGTLFSATLKASHIAGYELSYKILSGNQILVTGTAYRDCVGVQFGNQMTINVRTTCGDNFNVNLPQIGISPVQCYCNAIQPPNTTGGTNCGPGSGGRTCYQQIEYQDTIQLPSINCTEILISTSDCCRNTSISNINNPGSSGFYAEAVIYGADIFRNFSAVSGSLNRAPIFSQATPITCVNQPYILNQNARDLDGDRLEYSLIAAREGTTGTSLTYVPPMTPQNPIPVDMTSGNNGWGFCNQSGQLSFVPNVVGSYVVVIRIQEYRHDPTDPTGMREILIGTTMRDIQIQVTSCTGFSSSSPAYFREVDYTVRGTAIPSPTTILVSDPQYCPGIQSVTGSTCYVCPGSDYDLLIVARDPDAVFGSNMMIDIRTNLLNTFPPVGTDVPTFDVFTSPEDSLELWGVLHIPAACVVPGSFFIRLTDDVCPISNTQNINFVINTTCLGSAVTGTLNLQALENCSGQLVPTQVTVSDCIGNTVTHTVGNSSNLLTTYANACPGRPLTARWYLNGTLRTATSYVTATGLGFDILTCDNTVNSSTVSLCGQVFSAGNTVTSGTVLLYQVDSLGAFTLTDSTQLNSNGYCLTADILENYVILVIPNDSTRVPTYFGLGPNNSYLSSLNPADITPTRYGTANLALNISLVNSNNSTNITGTNILICGLFQGPRSNFRNAFAVLMNMNGEVLRSTKVEPNGSFTFRNIASGQYQIKVGYLHYPSTAGNICVGCPVPETLNFRLYNGRITPDPIILGNTVAFDNRTTLTVFPNPTKDNITLKGLQTQDLINVTDLFGRTVLSTSALLETQTLDVAGLPAGVYTISTPSTKPAKFVKM